MEASLKYHVSAFTASLSTKLVQIIQNPPLYLQRTPRGTQGFGKAGVFVKSKAEPPTGNAALYKGRGHSSIKASPAWYALQVGGRETVSTKNAYFCYRNFDVCALFKTVQAFSGLL